MASRNELEAWSDRWLKANQEAEKAGDWKPLADFYTEDATYGWNIGPKEDVMCVGRDEIRDVALGLEMEGLENWVYEYQRVLIDEKQNEIVGFWKQIANKSDGSRDEIYGIGGSWFRLNDQLLIEWQRTQPCEHLGIRSRTRMLPDDAGVEEIAHGPPESSSKRPPSRVRDWSRSKSISRPANGEFNRKSGRPTSRSGSQRRRISILEHVRPLGVLLALRVHERAEREDFHADELGDERVADEERRKDDEQARSTVVERACRLLRIRIHCWCSSGRQYAVAWRDAQMD